MPRNFSPFVARQYWRKRWAPRDRFRAPSGGNGAFASGASRVSWINGNHRHSLMHGAVGSSLYAPRGAWIASGAPAPCKAAASSVRTACSASLPRSPPSPKKAPSFAAWATFWVISSTQRL